MDDAYDIIAAGSWGAFLQSLNNPNVFAGCTLAQSAPGEVDITLPGGGVEAGECQVHITLGSTNQAGAGVGGNAPEVVHISNTVKRVRTSQAGALMSIDFSFVILRSYKRS